MYVQADQVNLANLAAFITVMENAFGNPNRVAEAQHKLNTIMQGSRDFCSYHAEFQRYASEVTWEEASKWASLQRGLSCELRKALILVRPQPATMAEFIEVCNDVDTQTRQLKSEGHRQSQQPQHQHRPAPRTQAATAASNPAPVSHQAFLATHFLAWTFGMHK